MLEFGLKGCGEGLGLRELGAEGGEFEVFSVELGSQRRDLGFLAGELFSE